MQLLTCFHAGRAVIAGPGLAWLATALFTSPLAAGAAPPDPEVMLTPGSAPEAELQGNANWPTSDRDFLRRSATVLPSLAKLEYLYFPATDFEDAGVPGGDLSVSSLMAKVPVGFKQISGQVRILAGINYELTLMDTGVPGLGGELELHRVDVPLSTSWETRNGKWRGLARVSAFAKTDFDSSISEAVGFTALVGAFRRVTDSLTVGLGAYYDYSFDDHFFTGGPGFVWAPNDTLSLGLIGPTLQARWQLNEDWRVRFEGRYRSQKWVVGNTVLAGDDTYLEFRNVRAVAALERKLFEPFGSEAWFSVQLGYRFLTKLDVKNADYNERFSERLEDNLFFGAGIRIQL